MRYAITGAAGHISNLLVQSLLRARHKVTVIGRTKDNLQELINAGADYAIGSVEDANFLKEAFSYADAVYTMSPYSFAITDIIGYYKMLGENYAEAIEANNISHVVNLSSVGAHLAEGAGPMSGLNRVERELDRLGKVNIMHLRPTYFYYNFLDSIRMIKDTGIMGSGFTAPRLPLAHQQDIADVAAEVLMKLEFVGHSVRYITSDEAGTDEIASVLGESIGKTDLKWVKFTPEQSLEGMLQEGLPRELALAFIDMMNSLDNGSVLEDYRLNSPAQRGSIKLEDFANEFAEAYNSNDITTHP